MPETIYAVSSGMPPAAIAVLRLSGAGAFAAASALAGRLPEPRRAAVRALTDPRDGSLLDRALVLLFPGPNSATGEDLAELHLHGGRAVVRAVETALAAMPGLRAAEPGEFTRRALTHGRIDLTEAEGLGDLLAAETEAQRRAAITTAEGAVRRMAEEWNRRLLILAAEVEATLDHSDEDDVEQGSAGLDAVRSRAAALSADIAELTDRPRVERLRDGVRVVLAGPPNAGKSTLLNAMADRDAAIVSPIAGTTRDRIEVPVVRDGIAYLLLDTAGLAEATDDPIERIGIARTEAAMADADILLWLGDDPPPTGAIAIHPRTDADDRAVAPPGRLGISAASGAGMDVLWTVLAERARALLPREDAVALNARQHSLFVEAAEALRAGSLIADPLLVAEHLRIARRAFDRVTGRADVEAMLDTLFGKFCIGK